MSGGTRKPVDSWPVIWRVTAPAAGSYDNDMVFLETESEPEAVKRFGSLRRSGCPVRLEQVRCGPLPKGYQKPLADTRDANAQNPGTEMGPIPAAWTD